ncbi:hypothetical protein MHU86_8336 [Fragilaria crotonensis]|nr:hypothetical protein MHU86_8336 [Fragilaria crotonensis]
MVPLANHRCVDSDKSSSAAATARDRRPVLWHGRQLAHKLVPAELRTSAALRAAASTTARTSERRCRRRQQRPSDASSPVPAQLRPQSPPQQSNPPPQLPFRPRPRSPAPSQTTRQPSASTDVDGDVGMTPEPLDRTPLRRPTTTMTTLLARPDGYRDGRRRWRGPDSCLSPRDSGSGQ